ncbi:Gag-like protein [Plakobranchus ocellatus]|uniref:Gag-like protein n=1 Tax=Plakobranchus ocellatus TaxID=259542 RepID=A0AAV4DCN2_9GAST|nr:Gag-like protein [Plakobranchus ocellatus]
MVRRTVDGVSCPVCQNAISVKAVDGSQPSGGLTFHFFGREHAKTATDFHLVFYSLVLRQLDGRKRVAITSPRIILLTVAPRVGPGERMCSTVVAAGRKRRPGQVVAYGLPLVRTRVELKSNDQAKKLGAIATFLDIPVTVSPHKSLNSSKGAIRSRDLRCCSEEEMVEELSGVTHARRI